MGSLQESTVRSFNSFTPEFMLIVTGCNYIVPYMIMIDDIATPVIKAENHTANIIHNIGQDNDNNFMTNLIKQHIFEFDEKFHQLHYAMNDF